MSFPANAIGVGSVAFGAGYLGYEGAKTNWALSGLDWMIVIALFVVGFYFGLILS